MTSGRLTSYRECLDYLFNLERGGIKYDLSNIRKLLRFLGNPEKSFRSIHVAGTNGKGSVSSMIHSYLRETGIRSGLYTSPHISDFRERILCGSSFVSKQFVVDFTRRMRAQIVKIRPSFFEITTAMAFDYFRHRNVEIAVVETGLGGRLDATNVIDPVLSVITGISVDHVEYLGSTIAGIAREKAGIIKKGKPVVTGKLPPEAMSVIKEKAEGQGSELSDSWRLIRGEIKERNEKGLKAVIGGGEYFIPEIGDFQFINAKTALTALRIFCRESSIDFDPAAFGTSLMKISQNSNLHGRFEIISRKPSLTVLDVSHNLEALKNLRRNIEYLKYKRLFIILGMMHDKDYCACIREISKTDADVILTRPRFSRAADPELMMNCVKKNKDRFTAFQNLGDAVNHAMRSMRRNDLLVVTGSFFLAGEFLEIFRKRQNSV
ncbi:MAG: bifunctional folylpolyglutamate synthase/dihydrofolate synthase [Ignavibacteria bacterium]|nr:bifunctional folylpolyglutamate synthase/dihydrofolate synthase [Ignavibacteria bacterium]